MNLRGKVINKYLNEKPKKFIERQRTINPSISYIHNDRMDYLLTLAYVLANRKKIISAAKEGYTKLMTPEEIVMNFYSRNENNFFEACCLEMGFGVTGKDIDKGCELDFDLYNVDLDKELLREINNVFNKIGCQTLSLF